jgi:hypothetical protein
MYGQLLELAEIAEQEHMRAAMMARARRQARQERRQRRGPSRTARAWSAFWAPRDFVLISRTELRSIRNDRLGEPCLDC